MRRTRARRRTLILLATLTMTGGTLGSAAEANEPAEPPMDYIAQRDRLSQPIYPKTVTQAETLEMADGETMYVQITKPDPDEYGDGPWPVILEASPYHGTIASRIGDRIFPDPVDEFGDKVGLTGYFAPRGYAVAMMDLRGTGRSTGCLDHLGAKDGSDMKAVIEWLADQPWSTGRVGMTGHSYVGSTPSVAAAQRPRGLVTIVPSAGLASMYDHQFQHGVPYYFQWAGPQYAYPLLSTDRDLPPGVTDPLTGAEGGDNWSGTPNPQTGCGWQNSAFTAGSGQVTGQYELWHGRRDWGDEVADADIPIFMIHGVNDNAARIPGAEWFFGNRHQRTGDKVWLGQWNHGSGGLSSCANESGQRIDHVNCRFHQWQYALHAWFDHHLMQRTWTDEDGVEQPIDTGPAVEVFLNGRTPFDPQQGASVVHTFPEDKEGKVLTADSWRRFPKVDLYPDAGDMSLGFAPPASDATASYSGADVSSPALLAKQHVGAGLLFESEPLSEDALFVGVPRLQLEAAVAKGQVTHLTATLYRETASGQRETMNVCAIQPLLRNGVATPEPTVPGQRMSLPMQCFTMAHWVPAGDHLELELSTTTRHHASEGGDEVTVFTGPGGTRYLLPQVPEGTLFDDVSLLAPPEPGTEFPKGPAQPGLSGQVLIPAPGVGSRVEPVTAAAIEFDLEEGFDNAQIQAVATATVAADLDLYLQRELADGSWRTAASSETGSTTGETLVTGRKPAGHYRLLVHNWAGGPQQPDVTITFFNQDGESGGSGGSAEAGSAQAIVPGTWLPGIFIP
jgi:predicted acyl esterase